MLTLPARLPLDGTYRAIGLMSGTSLDGVDIALIETDGEGRLSRGPRATTDYSPGFRDRLRQAIVDARGLTDRRHRPGCLADVERELTDRHAETVERFLGQLGLQATGVDCLGFHGQTVLHRPEQRLTVQLGDGHALAAATGIDVVYDLRADDCAAGGQGAPLVPVYHRALVSQLTERPIAIVNIGGVGNVTWIGRDGRLVAFDTGPGNALIDDWMQARTGIALDAEGAAARAGRAEEALLHQLLMHPYFAAPPPKSLDRDTFRTLVEDLLPRGNMTTEDGAATLTAFTAATIARSREHVPQEPELWIICGGGRRNRALMETLAGIVQNAVVPAEAVGLDGDSLEAEAWAYLAVRSLRKLPITFPGTTGVPQPMCGGRVAKAA